MAAAPRIDAIETDIAGVDSSGTTTLNDLNVGGTLTAQAATDSIAGLVTLDSVFNATQARFCKLTSTVSQTDINDGSSTIRQFDAAPEDTHSMADLGGNRITPNLPGLYYVYSRIQVRNETQDTGVSASFSIRKNGGPDVASGASGIINTSGTGIVNQDIWEMQASGMVEMNGTTDYVDVVATMDVTGTNALDWQFQSGSTLTLVRISAIPSLT